MSSAAAPGPRDNERRWFSVAVAFIVAVCAAVMVFGCSPRIVEKVIVQRDTTRIVQRDSVRFYDRDSIFVRVAGDTVYKYVEKWRWRDRVKTDTVLRVKVDSVAVERIKEVKVEKPLSAWKRAKIGAFWPLLAAVVALLLWTFRKSLLKLIKV